MAEWLSVENWPINMDLLYFAAGIAALLIALADIRSSDRDALEWFGSKLLLAYAALCFAMPMLDLSDERISLVVGMVHGIGFGVVGAYGFAKGVKRHSLLQLGKIYLALGLGYISVWPVFYPPQ